MKLSTAESLNLGLVSNYSGYDVDTVRDVLRSFAYLVNLAIYDDNNGKNKITIPYIGEVSFEINEILVKGKRQFKVSPKIEISDFIIDEVNKIKLGENSSLKEYHQKNINKFISRQMEIGRNEDVEF